MLKSLEQHNKEVEQAYKARLNGIACPKCGEELTDIRPDRVLISVIPQTPIVCKKCLWQGMRNVNQVTRID